MAKKKKYLRKQEKVMKRRKSLRRSQNAHRRLMLVHKKKTNGYDTHFIKMSYHSLCYERKRKKNAY